MSKISLDARKQHDVLRGEINFLKDFLKESSSRLVSPKLPPPKFSPNDSKELDKLLEFMKEASEGTAKKSIKINSAAVGKLLLSFAKPIKQKSILAEMATIYIVTLLEAHLKNLLRLILVSRPQMLRSSRQFTAADLLAFKSRSQFVSFLADKDVDDLGYGSIDDISGTFEKKMNIDFSLFPEWRAIRELCYRRNLIVHNQSVTNSIFCKNTNHPKSGEKLDTGMNYIDERSDIVLKFSEFVFSAIKAKFNKAKRKPNQAPEPTTLAVTPCAPSSTGRAS